jgi:hypothetical protein
MPNVLYIDHVEVHYRKDGRRAFGFMVFDDFESENVLCFDAEADVPNSIPSIVELCREEYCVNAIEALERCAEEGHTALLDGEPVDRAELAAVLAETRDD